jgi:hypothetical protein
MFVLVARRDSADGFSGHVGCGLHQVAAHAKGDEQKAQVKEQVIGDQ